MIVLLLIQRNIGGHIYVFYISDNQQGICQRTSNGPQTDLKYWVTQPFEVPGRRNSANAALYCMHGVVAELCRELLGQLPWPTKYCKSLRSEMAVRAVHLGQMPRCMHMQCLLRCRLPIAGQLDMWVTVLLKM